MSFILLASISMCLLAFGGALYVLWRLKDWRIAFLAAMTAVMTVLQIDDLLEGPRTWAISFPGPGHDLPWLILSIMVWLAVFFLERLIRARQRAEQELAQESAILEATLENMGQGISMFDADLKLMVHNKKYLELLDIPAERFKAGDNLEDMFRYKAECGEYGPGNVEKQVQERVERAKQFVRHAFERTRPDGTVVEIRGNPLPKGGFVSTHSDITERKRAEVQLREAKELAEARNKEVTEALEQQTATAEILGVISSSPTDAQPVFDMIAESAVRLCESQFCAVFRFDGELIHLVGHHGLTPEALEAYQRVFPMPPSRDTATGRAILSCAVVHIQDVEADSEYRYVEIARMAKLRSIVAVPILREGSSLGSIAVWRSVAEPFPDKQIELLKTFADQAVIAIENVRLFNETKESLERQTATAEILKVISSSPTEVQPVFDAIVQSGLKLFAGAAVGVALPDGDKVRLAAVAEVDPASEVAWRSRFPFPLTREYMHGYAILERKMVDVPDAQDAPGEWAPGIENFLASGYRAITIMPMMRGEQTIGVISVVRQVPGALSDKQLTLLKTFADQAVIAIENVRLFRELKARTGDLARSVQDLKSLANVSQAVSSNLDLDSVLTTIVTYAVQLTKTDAGTIYEFDDAEEVFIHPTR